MIVFGAFNAVLCGYLWILINEKDDLIAENTNLKVVLETQKATQNAQKIEYLDNLEKAKNESLNRLILNRESCQKELNSYKALIRAL